MAVDRESVVGVTAAAAEGSQGRRSRGWRPCGGGRGWWSRPSAQWVLGRRVRALASDRPASFGTRHTTGGLPPLGGRLGEQTAAEGSPLERLEPHSPVPFLVRRAVELGALPFPLLMQELIRDANVLSEMNRELGIKQRQESTEGG